MKVKGLIFDFDGLILDTETPEYQSWQEIYQSYGQFLPLPEWSKCIGAGPSAFDPLDYLEALIHKPLPRNDLYIQHRERATELLGNQPARPGVMQYLDDARTAGLSLAIASSSPRVWVDKFLGRLGLIEIFDQIITCDMVEKVKPAPDLFILAAKILAIPIAEAVAFEDSPNGIAAARAANMYVVAVPNEVTRLLDLSQANRIINSFTEIPLLQLLGSLNGRNHK
jgi:HAD superfamily hydrolase (TIGR01509 family)